MKCEPLNREFQLSEGQARPISLALLFVVSWISLVLELTVFAVPAFRYFFAILLLLHIPPLFLKRRRPRLQIQDDFSVRVIEGRRASRRLGKESFVWLVLLLLAGCVLSLMVRT